MFPVTVSFAARPSPATGWKQASATSVFPPSPVHNKPINNNIQHTAKEACLHNGPAMNYDLHKLAIHNRVSLYCNPKCYINRPILTSGVSPGNGAALPASLRTLTALCFHAFFSLHILHSTYDDQEFETLFNLYSFAFIRPAL